jgi:hypothetical protein
MLRAYWKGSSGSGLEQVAGSCEHGDEHSGSTKTGKFLEQLRDYTLLGLFTTVKTSSE